MENNEMPAKNNKTKQHEYNSNQTEWLNIKIQEYKTLRAEVIQAGTNSVSILQFGIIGISGLVYFGLTNWESQSTSIIVFLLFCPLVSYLILMIWAGEIARRFRASSFIHNHIEKEINQCFDPSKPVLHWEQWLRADNEINQRKRLFKWHRVATVALFLGISGLSILTGIYKNQQSFSSFVFDLVFAIEAGLFLVVAYFIYSVYEKLNQW